MRYVRKGVISRNGSALVNEEQSIDCCSEVPLLFTVTSRRAEQISAKQTFFVTAGSSYLTQLSQSQVICAICPPVRAPLTSLPPSFVG
jgi:hypothetical protein